MVYSRCRANGSLTQDGIPRRSAAGHGFGVEVGLDIDLLRQGYRVREVEVPLQHRVTGADWRSQVHRGRQWLDVGGRWRTGVPPVGFRRG